MEGTARSVSVRAALVAAAALTVVACASAPPRPSASDIPTLMPLVGSSVSAPTPSAQATTPVSDELPDTPMTTSALTVSRPQRGSGGAPVGAVVFGTDVNVGRTVNVVNQRTTFPAGRQVAWRVALPAAIGGESVRVTLTAADDAETLVDQFIAKAGWNLYYGKSLLTVAPGTYVLHYLVDGHELGSGTFKIKAADPTVPAPTGLPELTPTPSSSSASSY
jgi:hypothetical protein